MTLTRIIKLKTTGNPSIDRFLEHCHRRRYPTKSVIIYAGDAPDVLYYIVEGSVTVLIEDEDGHEIVLAYLNKGDFFGEMGLFGESSKRSAWVRTRSNANSARSATAAFVRSPKKIRAFCSHWPRRWRHVCAPPAARSPTWHSWTSPVASPVPCWISANNPMP